MERSPLASSSVASVGYDDATSVLEIEFKSGRIYQFEEVPRGVFDWLLRTPNKGAYVARMVSGKYRYRDITDDAGPDAGATEAEPDILTQLQHSVRLLEDKKPR